jgi:hypothetical protein
MNEGTALIGRIVTEHLLCPALLSGIHYCVGFHKSIFCFTNGDS